MRILIDGYNLIKRSPHFREFERIELQRAREALLEELSRYKRLKGHAITVVFDGAPDARKRETPARPRGVDVIFSRAGQKADDVLKRIAAEKKGEILVVTSDREVAHFAEKKGASVIGADEFAERMEMARYYDLKGSEAEAGSQSQHLIAPAKKGPSRRLPKSRRKAQAVTKKL
jgi:predicted RNA-binding protein with PIN domain